MDFKVPKGLFPELILTYLGYLVGILPNFQGKYSGKKRSGLGSSCRRLADILAGHLTVAWRRGALDNQKFCF